MYILLVSLLVVLVVWIAEESSLYTMNDGACKNFGKIGDHKASVIIMARIF